MKVKNIPRIRNILTLQKIILLATKHLFLYAPNSCSLKPPSVTVGGYISHGISIFCIRVTGLETDKITGFCFVIDSNIFTDSSFDNN